MIGSIEHSSYMSNEQRQHVLALLASLPVGCSATSQELLPCGQFAFTIDGPKPILAELRKQLIEIVGFETPGLRTYTLQEAYNTFGYRSYTNVRYKAPDELTFQDRRDGSTWPAEAREMVITGMLISSGQIHVRLSPAQASWQTVYVTLDEFARDFEWPDGQPCGVIVPSKSVQKRLDATGGKYRVGFD